jgi:F420-non-reducing hydrogenase iron-sulfur subunit
MMLEDFGLEPERFRLEWIASSEAQKFADVITQMTDTLRDLGPSSYNNRV